MLEKFYPGNENLKDEFEHIEAASKVNMNSLTAEIADLKNGIRMIHNELPFHSEKKPGDNFFSVISVGGRRKKIGSSIRER